MNSDVISVSVKVTEYIVTYKMSEKCVYPKLLRVIKHIKLQDGSSATIRVFMPLSVKESSMAPSTIYKQNHKTLWGILGTAEDGMNRNLHSRSALD